MDTRGRVIYSKNENLEFLGEIKGSLSSISQKEKYQRKQIEHPATHTIVVKGKTQAQPEDILLYHHQRYDVQRVEEPGEIRVFTILYCNKRNGVGEYGISAGKEGI